MYLVTLTAEPIRERIDGFTVNERSIGSAICTIVTDGFLSRYVPETHGFSVIESPLLNGAATPDMVFARVTYDDREALLSVCESVMSGHSAYYHLDGEGAFYCSSHVSMLHQAGVALEENREALPEFFVYRYVTPPRTLYKRVNRLLPQAELRVPLNDGLAEDVHVETRLPPLPEPGDSQALQDISARARAMLIANLQALAPCHKRFAVLLSGGIDSSILCRILLEEFQIRQTFSTGYPFEDPALNREKEYALSAAGALRS